VITVQGTYSNIYRAERADATITVHHENADSSAALDAALTASDQVRTSIEKLDSDSVARWSIETMQTWQEKPWSSDGTQLPLVSHARISYNVRFIDFDVLSAWLTHVARIAGVEVNFLDWDLEETSRGAALAEVRALAVQDAISKATAYANAIGYSNVSAIAVADPGMLGVNGETAVPRMMKSDMMIGNTPALSLKPEPVELTATVDARFIAS
jgi:uncharacterized protein YggE